MGYFQVRYDSRVVNYDRKMGTSVTKWCEILLLLQHFKRLWFLFEYLFSIGQNFESTSANCVCH